MWLNVYNNNDNNNNNNGNIEKQKSVEKIIISPAKREETLNKLRKMDQRKWLINCSKLTKI